MTAVIIMLVALAVCVLAIIPVITSTLDEFDNEYKGILSLVSLLILVDVIRAIILALLTKVF